MSKEWFGRVGLCFLVGIWPGLGQAVGSLDWDGCSCGCGWVRDEGVLGGGLLGAECWLVEFFVVDSAFGGARGF
ncbi:hypothetical protein GA0061094_1754 [[Bacillus] enclensis]|uniref:Uncharacterized protein n=1 Tax=[Bacillus] enclensis TaxID=1402860 RepID=A0A1C4AZT3_9BACI|nr:hypothetical protein GA0061094_1754 [[Bacillus] enclensis]